MIAVGHTSVGAIVGLASYSLLPSNLPLVAKVGITFVVAVGSHYLMDLVPHGHYPFDSKNPSRRSIMFLGIDLFLPVLTILLILFLHHGLDSQWWLVAAGIAGAQAPDVFSGLVSLEIIPRFGWVMREQIFHHWTHWHNPKDSSRATPEGGRKLAVSDVWQVVIVLLAVWLSSIS